MTSPTSFTPLTSKAVRRLGVLLCVPVLAGLAGVALTAAPADAVTCSKIGTSLKTTQIMKRGQCITSTNGRFTLVMQGDGNLVSYRNSDSRACFATATSGRTDAVAYVNPLKSTTPVPLELNVVHQSDIHNGYISFDGTAAGHPASTLNVSVSNSNGFVFVGYSEYYGTNPAAERRIC